MTMRYMTISDTFYVLHADMFNLLLVCAFKLFVMVRRVGALALMRIDGRLK